jgi:hypothetical protein
LGNSDKQAENQIMPLMKGFPSKHQVKEEKEAVKNSGMYLSIKKHVQGHLTLFGMGASPHAVGSLGSTRFYIVKGKLDFLIRDMGQSKS